jgi:hypothetical protein
VETNVTTPISEYLSIVMLKFPPRITAVIISVQLDDFKIGGAVLPIQWFSHQIWCYWISHWEYFYLVANAKYGKVQIC